MRLPIMLPQSPCPLQPVDSIRVQAGSFLSRPSLAARVLVAMSCLETKLSFLSARFHERQNGRRFSGAHCCRRCDLWLEQMLPSISYYTSNITTDFRNYLIDPTRKFDGRLTLITRLPLRQPGDQWLLISCNFWYVRAHHLIVSIHQGKRIANHDQR